MPIPNPTTKKGFSNAVRKLVHEGYKQKQAVAIAHSIKRKLAQKKHKET